MEYFYSEISPGKKVVWRKYQISEKGNGGVNEKYTFQQTIFALVFMGKVVWGKTRREQLVKWSIYLVLMKYNIIFHWGSKI